MAVIDSRKPKSVSLADGSWRRGLRLSGDDVAHLRSSYLDRQFAGERHELEALFVGAGHIRGDLYAADIEAYRDYGFNLSTLVVAQWVYQLGAIYVGVEQGWERKQRPLWLRAYSVACRRRVTSRHWTCTTTLSDRSEKLGLVLYQAAFDICEGSFRGSASIAVPAVA